MKKTTKMIEYEYDENYMLTKVTETVTEEEINTNQPSISPYHAPFRPYVGDYWKPYTDTSKIYTNEGGEPIKVTYDTDVSEL